MPQMNGVEFCRDIMDLPVKKIMVTGEADLDTAVRAFNEGIIDKFIVKDLSNFINNLKDEISMAQENYFLAASLQIMKQSPIKALANDQVISVLFSLFKQHQIREYYLIDPSGSYLGIDSEGRATYFIVRSDDETQSDLDIAIGNNADQVVIGALSSRTHALFLPTEADKQLPVSTWQNFLYPVEQTISGDLTYYFAVVPMVNLEMGSRDTSANQNILEI